MQSKMQLSQRTLTNDQISKIFDLADFVSRETVHSTHLDNSQRKKTCEKKLDEPLAMVVGGVVFKTRSR